MTYKSWIGYRSYGPSWAAYNKLKSRASFYGTLVVIFWLWFVLATVMLFRISVAVDELRERPECPGRFSTESLRRTF